MQHLSIVLAFFAVFGLAAVRLLDGAGAPQATQTANSTHVQHRQEVTRKTMVNQLGYLAQRVGALETDLAALKTTNAQLTNTIRQLAAREPLTTASIGRTNNARSSQFRSSVDPAVAGNASLPYSQGGAGLHLATFTNPAALATAWANLSRSESSYLSGLAPYAKSVRSSTGGTLYRLIAGPLSNSADAHARCKQLKRKHRWA